MFFRIIALIVLVCLVFVTFAWGTELTLSAEDAAQISSSVRTKINPSITAQRRSARTRMFIGVTIGLAGAGLALINESNRRPDPNTTGIAIGAGVIGFVWAFYNWMKLGSLGEAEAS